MLEAISSLILKMYIIPLLNVMTNGSLAQGHATTMFTSLKNVAKSKNRVPTLF